MKILLLNEDTDSTTIYSAYLNSYGHEVVALRDTVNVIETVAHVHPDVVVCDLVIHEDGSWMIPRLLRTDPRTREIPLIAVTALGLPGDRAAALDSGCDEVLIKPVRPAKLLDHLLLLTSSSV